MKCKTLGGIHIHYALSHIGQQVSNSVQYRQAVYIDTAHAYCLFHAITFERKVFSKIHESESKSTEGNECDSGDLHMLYYTHFEL